MIKKKIILPTKKFFKADEEDINIRVNLDETEALLRQGDKDIVLDIAQLFDDERNESNNYKIHGKLKMVFRNLYTGTTTYAPLKRNLYLNGEPGAARITTTAGLYVVPDGASVVTLWVIAARRGAAHPEALFDATPESEDCLGE